MPGKPKPTILKVLGGTARPDRLNPAEPTPALTDERPPSWLKGRARRVWGQVAPIVRDMKVLTDADLQSLALLCLALVEVIECDEVIRRNGRTYETTNRLGERMIKAHPAVGMKADAERRAALMLGRFGMSPADRARVSAHVEKDVDPFESYLAGVSNG